MKKKISLITAGILLIASVAFLLLMRSVCV